MGNLHHLTWQQEQEMLENAFVRQLLIKHNIKEVTTQRQAVNGTREFEFPCSTYQNTNVFYRNWLKSKGKSLDDTPRLRIACFKFPIPIFFLAFIGTTATPSFSSNNFR